MGAVTAGRSVKEGRCAGSKLVLPGFGVDGRDLWWLIVRNA